MYASKGSKKLLNAWASYDWANSVYPLVISTAVFPIYYGAICADQLYLDIFGLTYFLICITLIFYV